MKLVETCEQIKITYEFKFPDGSAKSYDILTDQQSLRHVPKQSSLKPEWTKLEHKKCGHCPLSANQHPHCPVALNLAHLVEDFKNDRSYARALVRVVTVDRVYEKEVDFQNVIFSIFGLIIATSDCPHTQFLKPMAKYHLPFSNLEETMVRSVSMYLLRQYFVHQNGGSPDWDLEKLDESYKNIQTLNEGLIERIRSVTKGDADANALVILHTMGFLLNSNIGSNLTQLKSLFA
jgi:hypothetical protein